jgi:hypothetical protein
LERERIFSNAYAPPELLSEGISTVNCTSIMTSRAVCGLANLGENTVVVAEVVAVPLIAAVAVAEAVAVAVGVAITVPMAGGVAVAIAAAVRPGTGHARSLCDAR